MNKCSIALLPERGLIEVKGPDAATFLQGLITNDIGEAKSGAALFAGLLSPQGKILFEFFVAPTQDGFILDCQNLQTLDLLKRLKLYKLRAKVEIADRSASLAVSALWGGVQAPGAGPDDSVLFPDPRLPGMGWRLIAPTETMRAWAARTGRQEAAASDYEAHRIGLMIPEGGKDYAFGDAYPHEACYDQLHGVDFKKGCYVGQEIVARMEFRKTARSRVVTAESLDGAALPPPGANLMAGESRVGTLGSSAGSQGLALVRLDRAEEALAKGVAITVNGIPIRLWRPAWANYAFADAAR
jgi:folate-binding protein YgfZ